MEELLRFDGPIGAQVRTVQEPQSLHGKELKRGERVFLLMNAANRARTRAPIASSCNVTGCRISSGSIRWCCEG